MQDYLNVLKRYGTFSGRSRRREYWMFILFTTIISFVLALIDLYFLPDMTTPTGTGLLGGIYALLTLVPSFAVSIRRLHDTGRSGWWVLIGLIPLVGTIVLLDFTVTDSAYGTNKWGPNPKGLTAPIPAPF